VVGVTGGLGAGKSTLCHLLSAQGFPVIDADRVAREMTEPGSPVLAELERTFGPGLVGTDGRLDRALLASRALADPAGQARLNAILHPRIRERLALEVARCERAGEPAVIIEATLILESGNRDFYDLLVVVVADDREKVRRAVRRGMDEEEAHRRLALLWPDGRKAEAAHRVIHNSGSLEELEAVARALAREIREAAAKARHERRRPQGE
jgi:dephospho-CoA kinase